MDINTISQQAYANIDAYKGAGDAGRPAASSDAKPTDKEASSLESEASIVELGNSQAVSTGYTRQAAAGQKGLAADRVKQLKSDFQASQQRMLQLMAQVNIDHQARLSGLANLTYNGTLLSPSLFELPDVGTTPEEAGAAISEGGAYSVSAVADRIFGLASAIAGDDADKLEEMRKAVIKGFKQAGISFTKASGQKDLPKISQDTYTEIMNRFDKLSESLRKPAQDANAAATE